MAGWQRNLYVITVAELIAIAGFSVVTPFLPFFIQDLGVSDPDQVKLWTGWITSSQAVTMAFMAPIWGSLADRFGRKIMVERAMFGGALIFLAMGFSQTVQHLLVLRALQGCVTGTVPAATALVASTTPRERSGSSLGVLQTGVYLGGSLGPLLGGLVADSLGYRAAFWVTSSCLLLAGVAVHWLVSEESSLPGQFAGRGDGHLWDGLFLVFQAGSLLFVYLVQLLARLGNRIVIPMLPLFVIELTGGSGRLATITGIIAGAGAFSAALGSLTLGRTSDRIGQRRLLLLCSLGMAVFYIPQSLVTDPVQLGILQVIVSFMMAGVLTSVAALLARWVPQGRQGAVYGISTTVVAAANALAPVTGAAVAVWWGLRSVFLAASLLFVLCGLVIFWLVPAGETLALPDESKQV